MGLGSLFTNTKDSKLVIAFNHCIKKKESPVVCVHNTNSNRQDSDEIPSKAF